jgi:beta-lactam-binding protein with PASTA domain
VPDVIGFPLERARALLQRLGFEVTASERESAEPTGRVIAVTPAPASEHELPATVALLVSIGLPPDTTAAPTDSFALPADTLAR